MVEIGKPKSYKQLLEIYRKLMKQDGYNRRITQADFNIFIEGQLENYWKIFGLGQEKNTRLRFTNKRIIKR